MLSLPPSTVRAALAAMLLPTAIGVLLKRVPHLRSLRMGHDEVHREQRRNELSAFIKHEEQRMFTSRITAHGAPFFVENGEGSKYYVSGNEAAKDWANKVDPNIKHIDMRSCHGAAGGPFSNAQMLANHTGAAVTGYDGRVNNLGGNAHRFRPQSSAVASATGTVNHAFGSIGAFWKKT
ncbi:hypothetical protein [Trinickia mobilis]|uniref:hypothetical protein n=1 Tax=Trinickia mobilis TaxID=2816356 RepID=UPI001A8CF74B|nr:hypothetical protein [Trinickia mobilis]